MEQIDSVLGGRTIVEAKVNGNWVRVAACSDPLFIENTLLLGHVVIARRPEFTIKPIGIESWLKKKLLLVTLTRDTEKCHSTTSWACTYLSAAGVVELDDICVLTDVRMQL